METKKTYTWYNASRDASKLLTVGTLILLSFIFGAAYKNSEVKEELDSLQTKLKNANGTFYKSLDVKVTSYRPTIEECDSTPFITASGHHITNNSYYKTCAVSKDLLYNYINFNDSIKLELNGRIYNLLVTDIVQGSKHIDVLCPVDAKWSYMPQGNGIIKYKIK